MYLVRSTRTQVRTECGIIHVFLSSGRQNIVRSVSSAKNGQNAARRMPDTRRA
ncbi:hypothetical protein TPADAL_0328a [Treponema pallidum subsp. pallidum DAL-1]|uniref:Uncharacterized protein n=2 Tax=Treponema pallidum TaxID=160 RepID=A0AAU8S4X2_TREPL|nr:hypothetical protein TPESAMD_0328a [Treponema pallidum subsp. pertenue str. SamoaD]AEZ58513.1 hypothetical protein TPECDC2_0328a [Treponema pallidum subsp. pertenue str. CDC2]AEZ59581.1 hypothetical protein TPEGAU_0328a [Treponema pallidum subsp. pertenue str. Gauthier]AEZ60645.1 hypothetical protein TPADAL_0328a [Treponema pallidum subsp. pallidum DAL-1]AGK83968.1 hypothetical protein TPFB_0328a [Treponema pallidum str. Fribourg-Blanc]AJB40342.1 hypothetical protein TENDBA_0328a [Treponema